MDVLVQEGVQSVTARRVAEALGASTAPVYRNFASMEALLGALRQRGIEVVLDYCRRPWSQDSFLSMGLGFIHFAVENPQLFRTLYLEPAGTDCPEREILGALSQDLDRHPFLGTLPQAQKDELLFQASIYSLGIAATVVSGRWEQPDLTTVEGWLRSVGGLLIRAALLSAGQPIPQEMEQRFGQFAVPWRHPERRTSKDGYHE
ncbi:MAG: helix-turn-helix domain-containing protein [Candidatus Krumholzibacteria bacterium]|jgi:AcrR family transcriptional regulator|nr:helix-turn-helix domain-containing protein [Candidatus Krumholzibacteria bacterium]